ncbi:MAG: metallophosphoesterase [Pseudomonadota bacterium]|nr:metallophosphoesterase [Pseudomonadota bacterium]
MLAFLLACTGPSDAPPADTAAPVDTAEAVGDSGGPFAVAFRYVVIADPHVSDPTGENLDRLDAAVAWINAEAGARDLRLVLVVGDIAWGDGMDAARASLDRLAIPYVPLNGDNEVHLGSEEAYALAFADVYDTLATTFDAWTMGPVAVDHPEYGPAWLHNLAFSYEGVRFVGLDWASRSPSTVLSELGELHDFEGGTFPFFEAEVGAAGGELEDVVLFGHMPMHLGVFDLEQMARIAGVTAPHGDHVWADLAGHFHANGSQRVEDGGYDVYVTDATWDDDVELRIVEVQANRARFAPTTDTVVVPY